MQKLSDNQLGGVSGGPGFNKKCDFPNHAFDDLFKSSDKFLEQNKIRNDYVKKCYAQGIKPDPAIAYNPCIIS